MNTLEPAVTILILFLASFSAGAVPKTGDAAVKTPSAAPDTSGESLRPATTAESACEGANIDKRYCNHCHSQTAQLYAVAQDLWRVDDLLIDPDKFAASTHGKLDCLDCHAFTWPFFPHPRVSNTLNIRCPDCHGRRQPGDKFRFDDINKQMHESIHYKKLKNEFSCDSCHDPHTFQASNASTPIPEMIRRSNALCTRCHMSKYTFSEFTDRAFPNLEEIHDWLPNQALHWKHVRCVECHTPADQGLSHLVRSAKASGRFCEKCHSANSVLLTKLYRHRIDENREKYGFTNSIVFNEAYIIGMTRNEIMDKLFLALLVLTLLGIGGHGTLRYIAGRRRRKHGE